MTAFVTGTFNIIEDSKGAPYLAVVLDGDRRLLDASWLHLTQLGLAGAVAARHNRDGKGNAHVTIAGVSEWGGLLNYKHEVVMKAERLLGTAVEMQFHGIGCAQSQKYPHTAWYGILSCEPLARLRSDLGLRAKDLHVTLAFDSKDVFDSDKGLATMLVSAQQMLASAENIYSSGPNPC